MLDRIHEGLVLRILCLMEGLMHFAEVRIMLVFLMPGFVLFHFVLYEELDRFGVTATQMADDAQIVRGAAGRGVIAVAARGHQGLGAEIGRFGEVAADEGDGAARVERVTLDAMLAELARPAQGAIDPLQALFVAAEPRLRDAVEQREGRILELTLLA